MSDIAQQIAVAKKELQAIKTGFAGGEDRFFPSVATAQTFVIAVTDRPIVISATFAETDFPQLFASVSLTIGGPPIVLQYKAFDRKTLYAWRMTEYWGSAATYTIQCALLSQRAPLTFTCVAE